MKAAVTTRSEEFDIIWQYPEGDVMRYPFNNAEARSKALANLTAIGGREIMKREQQHTPTPWKVGRNDRIEANGRVIADMTFSSHSQERAAANAQYIVTAVNSHEKLIEAIRFALTTPGMIKGRDKLEAALASADAGTWSGSPDPTDPDNYWIDDNTGERVNATTGERTAGTVAAGAEYDPDCPTCLEQEQRQFQERLRQTMLSNPLVKEVDLSDL